jgi:hypothetical protein
VGNLPGGALRLAVDETSISSTADETRDGAPPHARDMVHFDAPRHVGARALAWYMYLWLHIQHNTCTWAGRLA